MAYGSDRLSPWASEDIRDVRSRGVAASRAAGDAIDEQAVRRWAEGRRYTDEAVESLVANFRSL